MRPTLARHLFSTSIGAALLAATASPAWAACKVQTPPDGWSAAAVTWEGACVGDSADGLGLLKEMQGGAVKRSFLGRASKGELLLGVVEEPGKAFVAGHFEKGRLLVTEDRWPAISAFEEAAKAATEAAGRADAAGDKAGAAARPAKSGGGRKHNG